MPARGAPDPIEVVRSFLNKFDRRPSDRNSATLVLLPLVEPPNDIRRLCLALNDGRALTLFVENTWSLQEAAWEAGCSKDAILDMMDCSEIYGLSADGITDRWAFSRRRIMELQVRLQDLDGIRRSFPPGWMNKKPRKRARASP